MAAATPARAQRRQKRRVHGRAPAPSATARSAGIQVIARAAEILRVLQRQPDGLSLSQIAKAVGLARSTVQRIVAALVREDFVSPAGPSGGVRIGAGLMRLAASLGSNTAELLRPLLRALSEDVGETVDLAVLSGGSAVFIDQIPGRKRLVALPQLVNDSRFTAPPTARRSWHALQSRMLPNSSNAAWQSTRNFRCAITTRSCAKLQSRGKAILRSIARSTARESAPSARHC